MWDARDTCKMYRHTPTYVIRHARAGAKSAVTVHMANCIHAHNTVQLKPKLQNMEPDRPQLDRPADCVIAQQYSSATFSHCALIPARKKLARVSKVLLFLARARNSGKRLSASSCLSICLHGTTRIPLEGFS